MDSDSQTRPLGELGENRLLGLSHRFQMSRLGRGLESAFKKFPRRPDAPTGEEWRVRTAWPGMGEGASC